jgi:hypothetical protein
MIRNPKAFEVWSACSRNAPYVITELEILPKTIHPDSSLEPHWIYY